MDSLHILALQALYILHRFYPVPRMHVFRAISTGHCDGDSTDHQTRELDSIPIAQNGCNVATVSKERLLKVT